MRLHALAVGVTGLLVFAGRPVCRCGDTEWLRFGDCADGCLAGGRSGWRAKDAVAKIKREQGANTLPSQAGTLGLPL